MKRYLIDSQGRYIYIMKPREGGGDPVPHYVYKHYVYSDDTIQSMLTPAAYSSGTYPYGWCVTDSGNTYQVNNYSGTSEALAHADWDDLGTGAYFVPVATHQDLNDVRAAITKTWGAGTPFEGSYVGQGLAGNYIQVSDIDLEFETQNPAGAYYNSGAGWSPIGTTFTGRYNGGGRVIDEMFINTPSIEYCALFYISGVNSVLENIFMRDVNVTGSRYVSALVGYILSEDLVKVRNCFSSGIIYGTNSVAPRAGGLAGQIKGCDIQNSYSFIVAQTTQGATFIRAGSLVGAIFMSPTPAVLNSYSVGFVSGGAETGGLVGHIYTEIDPVSGSYYNTETSGQSDTGKGVPKTTAELLAGVPSAGIYTDWDTRIWRFVPGRYPIHKFFGELPTNIPPPTNLQTAISGSDIVLTWDDYTGAPKPLGYFVYVSKDSGVWTKINATKTTDKTLTYTPTGAGSYNFFVTAVYFRRFEGQTGNSPTTVQVIA